MALQAFQAAELRSRDDEACQQAAKANAAVSTGNDRPAAVSSGGLASLLGEPGLKFGELVERDDLLVVKDLRRCKEAHRSSVPALRANRPQYERAPARLSSLRARSA